MSRICLGEVAETRPYRLSGPGLADSDIISAEVSIKVHPSSPPSGPPPPAPTPQPRRSLIRRKRDECRLDPSSICDKRRPRKRKRVEARVDNQDATAKKLATSANMNLALRENCGHAFRADTVVGVDLGRTTPRRKERELKKYLEDRWGFICEECAADTWGMSDEQIEDVAGIQAKVEAFIEGLSEGTSQAPTLWGTACCGGMHQCVIGQMGGALAFQPVSRLDRGVLRALVATTDTRAGEVIVKVPSS
ncbi:hypothetical protein F4820DRAFT_454118 [Hypoxylon rubiginosum]|uniref:Uncharacterized protein n=1 Tax=Hypoxylon rubiginosum TaxID=110542 RepID=A0ACB9YIG8_9PEZI|nr:hypothetical protein F4820DRAFT_454118 [Hypoxylon rubiginosum]